MAGVAQLFDLVRPGFGLGLAVFDGTVDEQKIAAWFEHTGGFADELPGRTEVVSGDAAGDEVELGICVREFFGGVLPGDEAEAAFLGGAGGAIEHGLGEIGGRHFVAASGEENRRVTGAGGDVKNARVSGQGN